jgi:hypothetical protein
VKHRGEFATEHCYICRKPICPKCMEMFGYVCSPLCKAKAESHGIKVPVYAGQKSVVEARLWRKVGMMSAIAAVVVLAILGVWFWYAWFGSTPRPVFALRFNEPMLAGMSWVGGKDKNDLVFIHGSTLGRARVNQKQPVWTKNILDTAEIKKEVDSQIAEMRKWIEKAQAEGWDRVPKMPQADRLQKRLEKYAMEDLRLQVRDHNIWVFSSKKIVRYDWETGTPAKEIVIAAGLGMPVAQGDVLLFPINEQDERKIGRLDLKTGDWQLGSAGNTGMFVAAGGNSYVSRFTNAVAKGTGGLDAGKLAERAQNASLPERIALPATLSGAINRDRVEQELASGGNPRPAGEKPGRSRTMLMPDGNKAVEVSTELLEEKMVERVAMKAAPAKSKLDSAPSVANTMEIANEILNDMRRSGGDDKIIENQSLYQVTLKDAGGSSPGWSGQVNGPPSLFPLKTVHVLTCFKKIMVFDKSYKKLWENTLNYDVRGSAFRELEEDDEGEGPTNGQGPCVERDNTLYVYDAGTLSCFDLKTGDVRWRLPSVGVYGMFFDDKGAIYLNTTTAGPDSLKYAKQIDISRPGFNAIAKVNPKNGAVLWQVESAAPISYLKDQFIYTIQSYRPFEPEEDEDGYTPGDTGFEKPPYLRIRRINPKTGGIMWEHFQDRAPLDAGFDGNMIRLVFKKEVQVLRFLSF